jgi:Family of unknown function (DUF6941)
MPIIQKHAIVCDDARQENNGKWILIGMYTPDMQVPQIPFVLPTLTFFAWLESDRPGSFPFRIKLEHLESGASMAEGMGVMQFAKPGIGVSTIRFGGLQFSSPGAYVFSIQFDGQPDRLLTQFSVILAAPQQPGMQQQRR